MSDVKDVHLIDAQATPARQAKFAKDRRRPGRIHDVYPALIPLLRHPIDGLVADPVDRFQIAAEQAASSYPAVVWRSLSTPIRNYGDVLRLSNFQV
jgi:hypothetical protein